MKKDNLINQSWKLIIEKYNIIDELKKNNLFHITANRIKEFREPRLMAKFDSSKNLPEIFINNSINILPVSRASYVLGHFKLYESFPELTDYNKKLPKIELEEFETIDIERITSESNAINVLKISGILEDFLELKIGERLYPTFNGRMNSGEFEFVVETINDNRENISVKNAQIEIDAGFESETCIVIVEAKNVINDDFHIRQLYYPFRKWDNLVKKPVRLIFSIYSNMIFRMLEYEFADKKDYSSIRLVKQKFYTLEDTDITEEDLKHVYNSIRSEDILTDELSTTDIPFIQADSFERIISLLEAFYEKNNMTDMEIQELMQFTSRQAEYYCNAGKYLGIFEKGYNDKKIKVHYLTKLGKEIFELNYKKRQLKLVEQILKHEIFRILFLKVLKEGEFPDKKFVSNLERKLNVTSKGTSDRRAQTIIAWLKWIYNLKNL